MIISTRNPMGGEHGAPYALHSGAVFSVSDGRGVSYGPDGLVPAPALDGALSMSEFGGNLYFARGYEVFVMDAAGASATYARLDHMALLLHKTANVLWSGDGRAFFCLETGVRVDSFDHSYLGALENADGDMLVPSVNGMVLLSSVGEARPFQEMKQGGYRAKWSEAVLRDEMRTVDYVCRR